MKTQLVTCSPRLFSIVHMLSWVWMLMTQCTGQRSASRLHWLCFLDVAQGQVSSQQWYDLMVQYARAHTRSHPLDPTDDHGNPVPARPWIGEDIHPDLGYWIARDYMYRYVLLTQCRPMPLSLHTYPLLSRQLQLPATFEKYVGSCHQCLNFR